jgi:DNA recombination protein RmuC
MVYLLLSFAVLVTLLIGTGLGVLVAQRARADVAGQTAAERDAVVAAALDAVRQERGASMQAALDTALSVASSKLGDQMQAGVQVIDRERSAMSQQVENVQGELRRVGDLVTTLQQERAEQNGRLSAGLEQAVAVTNQLASTTTSLRDALASPKSRGQWGERMAEDVLRMAGFVDGVNYTKQTQVAGRGVPDYTFNLPKGHVVHMDVKFPIDNYLRCLEHDNDADREQYHKAFKRDVRSRVKELADRAYINPETTVDYLLLFIPNESVYGFLHEHDPGLIDMALAQKVVLCSPTSLFAVLAVIRQAVDNFLVERRSDEILSTIGGLRDQWQKFGDSVDKVGRGLQSAQKGFDDLVGPRTRQFEKQLSKLESVRDNRAIESGSENEPETDPVEFEEQRSLRQVV